MASSRMGAIRRANIVLFGALFTNLGIAMAKFVAAALTGSSSMLSEDFHSLVDSGNQLLLLYGQYRAKRPADARHPVQLWARTLFLGVCRSHPDLCARGGDFNL